MRKGLLLVFLVVAGLSAAPPKVKAQQSTTVYPGTATLQTASLGSTTCPGTGCLTFTVTSWGSAAIQLSGTWNATVAFQGSLDGTNYQSIACTAAGSTTGALATSATANGLWICPAGGMTYFRVVATAFSSGPVSVNARPTWMNAGMGHGGGSSSSSTGTFPWINVKDYGATGDGTTNDYAAVALAIAAMPNPPIYTAMACDGGAGTTIPCPHTTGSILYFPAGTYNLGGPYTTASAMYIQRSYYTIKGDGIDKTIIKFASSVVNPQAEKCNGTGICTGFNNECGTHALCEWDIYRDIAMEDFTLQDTNTDRAFIFNIAAAAGISLTRVDRVRISRVRCVNCKGNASFDILGGNCNATDCNFGGQSLIMEDNECVGTIDWDCFNTGNFYSERYSRNYFAAEWNATYMTGNIMIEGHGMPDRFVDDDGSVVLRFPHNLVYENNYATSTTLGGLEINAGEGIFIHDNWVNIAGRGIQLNGESAVTNYSDVHVEDNVLYGNGTGTRGILFTGNPGTSTHGLTAVAANVFFDRNVISALVPIDVESLTGALTIRDNWMDNQGNTYSIQFLTSITCPCPITISNNVAYGTVGGGFYILDWSAGSFPLTQLRNHSARMFDNITDPIDANVGFTNGASVLGAWVVATNTPSAVSGTSSSVTTVTVSGAIVGDDITVRMSTELPQDVYLRARVTANDTLSYWIQNQSGTNYDGTGVALKILVERRR